MRRSMADIEALVDLEFSKELQKSKWPTVLIGRFLDGLENQTLAFAVNPHLSN